MAGFNGSGTFVRTHNWVTDKGNSVKVTASRMDAEDDGFATGLSTCITKDGQQTTTAAIPFAVGIKVSDGSVTTPALNFINDTDSGIYRIGANNLGIAVAGANIFDIGTATVSCGVALVVAGSVTFVATASAAVISGGSIIGASATFTATCQAAFIKSTGEVAGATANFTGTCSAAVVVSTGEVRGASANFTATCAAVTLAASGAVTGASATFTATCEAAFIKSTGEVAGATANFTGTCSAAVVRATGLVAGASASFTATCAAAALAASGAVSGASLAATGAVTGASATFTATCEAAFIKSTGALNGDSISGVALKQTVRAWGRINADSTVINHYNVASATHDSTGDWTVIFATPMNSSNYGISVIPLSASALIPGVTDMQTGQFSVKISARATGNDTDSDFVFMVASD